MQFNSVDLYLYRRGRLYMVLDCLQGLFCGLEERVWPGSIGQIWIENNQPVLLMSTSYLQALVY